MLVNEPLRLQTCHLVDGHLCTRREWHQHGDGKKIEPHDSLIPLSRFLAHRIEESALRQEPRSDAAKAAPSDRILAKRRSINCSVGECLRLRRQTQKKKAALPTTG